VTLLGQQNVDILQWTTTPACKP